MRLSLLIATAITIALTLIAGVIDGQRRFRWGEDTEVTELAARLNQFPTKIGGWETTSELLLDKSATGLLRPVTAIHRVYFNPQLQMKANVFLLLGPTGPTSAHTPDICFNSREYKMIGTRRVASVHPAGIKNSQCFVAQFQNRNISSEYLRSWYAWTVDGTWHAPERPRFNFAKSRYLFKMQIVAGYPSRQAMDQDDAGPKFVAEIEKTLQKTVF